MHAMSFARQLAGLDAARLTRLLESRPDVLVEPVPRGFEQLAQRLSGAESLSSALRSIDRDLLLTAQAVALLGDRATAVAVAGLLRAPQAVVAETVDRLVGRGLAWKAAGKIHLPQRLGNHFRARTDAFRPVALIAQQAVVEGLRAAVAGLGGDPAGLRKPELTARLEALMADPATVQRAVAGLAAPARRRLDQARRGTESYYVSYGRGAPRDPDEDLVQAGLMLRVYGRGELPREIAVAALLHERSTTLTGRPQLPAAAVDHDGARRCARAAADAALLGLVTLLDEARTTPITALKKGGVGPRERARLAKRLSIEERDLVLWIDVAAAAGLLAPSGRGYLPTAGYDRWREEPPGTRWARAARAWFELDFAPTQRETDAHGEVAPPIPLLSGAGLLRRALLEAAAAGRSLRAAAAEIEWFCPGSGYAPEYLPEKLAAAVHEGEQLGVVVDDALSELGEHLVARAAPEELVRRCADLLPEAPGLLVLQSDLSAVVSGQPSTAASRLLAAAAVAESRGVAATWRFTPASVRAALDAGWTADELRAGLVAIADRALPQPLDYLIGDVARRHGNVRVRGSRCCVVGGEAEVTEILHTRALHKLHLARLAPTVLTSPFELDEVLARLRDAGFAPMPEDAEGVVIVADRRDRPVAEQTGTTRQCARVGAAEFAARLLAHPDGWPVAHRSVTGQRLAKLTGELTAAELDLLADALDNGHDVSIVYRDNNGSATVRQIQPRELSGQWLESWCYLRSGQREFTVANIEAVAPVG